MIKKSINLLLGLALLVAPVLTSCETQKDGPDGPNNEVKPLSESTLTLGANAGDQTKVTFEFESSWQVNNGLDWLKVSPLSGFSGANELTIEAKSSNESMEERVGYFSLAVNGGLIKTWVVQDGQKGLAPAVELVGASAEAGDVTFEVNGNVAYEASTEDSWITVKNVEFPDSVLLADNATRSKFMVSTVTISLSENTGDMRYGTVILTDADGTDYNVEIAQMGQMVADYTQDFYRRSIAIRFTATWCGYCPVMAASIDGAIEALPGRIIPFTLHATSSQGGLAYSGTANFEGLYNIGGYPTGIFNGYADVPNYQTSSNIQLFQNLANEAIEYNPSNTNIGGFVSLSNGKVKAQISVASKEAGEYKIAAFLLEDGIVYTQASGGSDYVHNYVVRKEMTGIYGDAFSAQANSIKDFEYTIDVPSSVKDASKLHVVVYIINPNASSASTMYASQVEYLNLGTYVDQVVDIPVNNICEFKYE